MTGNPGLTIIFLDINNLNDMEMMNVVFISFTLFAAYIAAVIVVNKGVPASVSDSFYILNAKATGLGYIFTLWCYAIGISVAAMMFDASAGMWYQFLGLFAGGGLCFVGTAPLFKGHERIIHFTSAAVCAVAAILWMGLSAHGAIPLIWALIAVLVMEKYGNPMFWAEIALFASMYITLFLNHV
jgi:hypothetical protein